MRTCQFASGDASYKILNHGVNPSNQTDTFQYHFEQVPEGCPSTNTACSPNSANSASWTAERTYTEAKDPCSADLPLVNYTAWKPPEYICLADCQSVSYQTNGVCVTNLTQGCTPPTCFAGEGSPPITDGNGNDNLIWIKLYNSEDPTLYECVPVLYDKTILSQYELCEE